MSVMPIYNIIALPGAKLWVHNKAYRKLTGKAPVAGERVTLLVQKEDQERKTLTSDSFQAIGVVGSIMEDSGDFLTIAVQNRVNIEEIAMLRDGSFSMTVSRRADIDDLDTAECERRLTVVKDRFLSFSRGKRWEGMLRNFAAQWDNLW